MEANLAKAAKMGRKSRLLTICRLLVAIAMVCVNVVCPSAIPLFLLPRRAQVSPFDNPPSVIITMADSPFDNPSSPCCHHHGVC